MIELVNRGTSATSKAFGVRVVLCLPLRWSGLIRLLHFSGGTAEMVALGLERAWLFNALTILVQLGASLLVILNRWTLLGALGIVGARDHG